MAAALPNLEPLPQQVRVSGEAFPCPAAVCLLDAASDSARQCVRESARRWQVPVGAPGYPVLAGLRTDREVARQAAPLGLLDGDLPAEGYALRTSPEGAILVGADQRGLGYGLDTLWQLVGTRPHVPAVTIHDWPDMPVRGVFLTWRLGPTDPQVMAELIGLLARYRITHLCLELERGLRYESHPEVAAPWAMRRDTAAGLATALAAAGIELVPMVPTLNHVEYLLKAHPELAEDPDLAHPGWYCPNRPETWRLVDALLDEVVELFQPRLLHVGHDEIVSEYEPSRRRSVRCCPACRRQDAAAWFAAHVQRVRDLLAGRGVRTMMWADMLLTPDQHLGHGASLGSHYGGPPDRIHRAVALLPRDIVLCDWHYEVTGDYPSYEFLLGEGFTVLACPWKAESILTFAHRVHRQRQALAAAAGSLPGLRAVRPAALAQAPGLLCTNWCAVDASHAAELAEQVRWAGEFAWTADRAAWLSPPTAALLRLLDGPNPTRDLPPGPFAVDLALGRLEGGLSWTAGTIAGQDGDGMTLKAQRTGWLLVLLTAAPGCCFARVEAAVEGQPAGPVAISVSTGAGGAAWPVADAGALDGRCLELTRWSAGAGAVWLRFDLRNDGERPAQILRRVRLAGQVVPRPRAEA